MMKMKKLVVAVGIITVLAMNGVAQQEVKAKTLNEIRKITDLKEQETELKTLIPTLDKNISEQGNARVFLSALLRNQGKTDEAIAEVDDIVSSEKYNNITKAKALQQKYAAQNALKNYLGAATTAEQMRIYSDTQLKVLSYEYEGAAKRRLGDTSGAINAYNAGLAIKNAPEKSLGGIAYLKASITTEQEDYLKVLEYITYPQYIKAALNKIQNFDTIGYFLAKQLKATKETELKTLILEKTATSEVASRVLLNEFSNDVEIISTLLQPAKLYKMELQARWDILAKIRASIAGQIATDENARALAGIIATEMEEVATIMKGAK